MGMGMRVGFGVCTTTGAGVGAGAGTGVGAGVGAGVVQPPRMSAHTTTTIRKNHVILLMKLPPLLFVDYPPNINSHMQITTS
jgi:hypothetical protein